MSSLPRDAGLICWILMIQKCWAVILKHTHSSSGILSWHAICFVTFVLCLTFHFWHFGWFLLQIGSGPSFLPESSITGIAIVAERVFFAFSISELCILYTVNLHCWRCYLVWCTSGFQVLPVLWSSHTVKSRLFAHVILFLLATVLYTDWAHQAPQCKYHPRGVRCVAVTDWCSGKYQYTHQAFLQGKLMYAAQTLLVNDQQKSN